jgi:hypothetical protein
MNETKARALVQQPVPPIPVIQLSSEQCNLMSKSAFLRILNASADRELQTSILIKLISLFGLNEHKALMQYILADFDQHYELALRWLYALFGRRRLRVETKPDEYDSTLSELLAKLVDHPKLQSFLQELSYFQTKKDEPKKI